MLTKSRFACCYLPLTSFPSYQKQSFKRVPFQTPHPENSLLSANCTRLTMGTPLYPPLYKIGQKASVPGSHTEVTPDWRTWVYHTRYMEEVEIVAQKWEHGTWWYQVKCVSGNTSVWAFWILEKAVVGDVWCLGCLCRVGGVCKCMRSRADTPRIPLNFLCGNINVSSNGVQILRNFQSEKIVSVWTWESIEKWGEDFHLTTWLSFKTHLSHQQRYIWTSSLNANYFSFQWVVYLVVV